MQKFYLENLKLKITINQRGAELSSIFSKENGTEYLWNADEKYWKRSAPVLFPIVGSLKDGKYTVAVSTQGGGGQSKYELFIIGDNGEKKTAPITDNGWNKWQTVEIKDVIVKNGKATIGVEMQAKAGSWGSMDNFEFYLQQ